MIRERDLTQGNIRSTLVKLALPIMGTSFINILYNLTDIMWLGRYSTDAVSAAGSAGFFTWLGNSIIIISQVGVGIWVSQSYGRRDFKSMKKYISNGLRFDAILGIIYTLVLFFGANFLMSFFNLQEIEVVNMAVSYLKFVSIGVIFHFLNPVISSTFNAVGNSFTPFLINTTGLIINMILDPLLIFGLGPIPSLGIKGAAIATSIAQFSVTIIFVIAMTKNKDIFSGLNLLDKLDFKYVKDIVFKGVPVGIQSSVLAMVSMTLGRIIAVWGATGLAVQTTGAQIESVSWMTAEGFANGITVFIGQNYGAENYERVKQGYYKGLQMMIGLGLITSMLFIFKAEAIFKIFIPNDPEAIKMGGDYLRILGLAQTFMTVEIASNGAFNGLGKPVVPAVIATMANIIRIPIAIFLTSTSLKLNGVWWSVSITMFIKGIVIASLCFITINRVINEKIEER